MLKPRFIAQKIGIGFLRGEGMVFLCLLIGVK
jgi:hypothetical protein